MKNKFAFLFSRLTAGRLIGCFIGNLFIGIGSAILRLTLLGNDPFTGMNLGIADATGIPYVAVQIFFNLIVFGFQIAFGRDLIGVGTLINAFLLSSMLTAAYNVMFALTGGLESYIVKLLALIPALLFISLGLALYQDADIGVAPYDSLPIMLRKKFPKLPYFFSRIIFDGSSALICFLTGGIVGVGMLASVFCLGPLVNIWDRLFVARLYGGTSLEE